MLPLLKRFAWVSLLAASAQASFGFSLLGPLNEPYQVITIGYNVPGDNISGPKNLGEEYRRNVPVLYYAFDANFLDFFGSNGVAAVNEAFAHFNSISNASAYSPDLSEVPYEAQQKNYLAESLFLIDVKSWAM